MTVPLSEHHLNNLTDVGTLKFLLLCLHLRLLVLLLKLTPKFRFIDFVTFVTFYS